MKLNKKQFEEYIRKNGITKARLNKKFHHIPENTELWFGLWGKNISTYDSDTGDENKRFNYEFNDEFDYADFWKNYKGKFIIDEIETPKKEMKNKIVLEADTELKDNELREWVNQLNTKIDTINDRTKKHTLEIKQLRKELKKWFPHETKV